jgi:hypothetical protein
VPTALRRLAAAILATLATLTAVAAGHHPDRRRSHRTAARPVQESPCSPRRHLPLFGRDVGAVLDVASLNAC